MGFFSELNETEGLPLAALPLTVHVTVGSGSPSTSQRTVKFWYSLAV